MTAASVRAQKRALQEHMLGQGLGFGDIAAELARRHGLRPRTAHREARCLTLRDAALQISELASSSRPGRLLSWSHLADYERWPGGLAVPTGRRPTLPVLAAMAAFYGTPVAALIDTLDRDHFPAADLLVIDTWRTPGSPGCRGMTVPARPRLLPGSAASPEGGT